MRRSDTNVSNANKLFMSTHPQVPEERGEAQKDKFDRYAIVITIDDGGVRIVIGFPAACLKIDAKSVRGKLTEDFIRSKFASNKSH